MRFTCRRIIFICISFCLATSGYFAVFYVKNAIQSDGRKVLVLSSRSVFRSDLIWGRRDKEEEDGRDDQQCVHPKLQLWHPALKNYFKDPKPLQCLEDKNWVYVSNGSFYISAEAERKHGKITCQYIPKLRPNSDFGVENGVIESPMANGSSIQTDFFQAVCSSEDGKKYTNIHSGIAYQKKLHEPFNWSSLPSGALGMNILMFGFDSTSRMTWLRNLPKTHEYLTDTLGGVVLEGYNIVGDGTPQALLPILTGQTEVELPEARRGHSGAKPVDNHPWIWKELKKLGYVTQWGEDGAGFGTFTYRMLGFKQQPVDHYMRPFYLEAEKLYGSNPPFCLGSEPRHLNMLNWIRHFYDMYPNKPKFSFLFHSEYTHGGYSEVRVVDQDLLNFLKGLHTRGHLNNTLLIMMADHGARFQAVRQTVQGKYEERMPYFTIALPEWFKQKHPKAFQNLKDNARKLTSPFDIHKTFHDIINFTGPINGSLVNRGISLFKNIPMERNCGHAAIEPHWCACLRWQSIGQDSGEIKKSAAEVLGIINGLTQSHRDKCASLTISNITEAVRYVPNRKLLQFKQSKDVDGRLADLSDDMSASEVFYQLTFSTVPGNGSFEATVKYIGDTGTYMVSDRDISRINKYGDAPKCVADSYPQLRPYCYCTSKN